MAKSPFGRGILDWLPDEQRGPLGIPDPAAAIGNALSNANTATRQNPQQTTPWMTDVQDPWGGFNATPQMNDNTPQLGGSNQATDLWGGFNATPQMNDGTTQLGGTPAQQTASTIAGALPQTGATQQGATGDGSLFSTPDIEGSFGSRWDGQRWINNPNGVPAGSAVGKTGATLPVAYNASSDVFRHEFNGQAAEQSRSRVMRWAGDNQRLYGMDAQSALNSALARLKRDMGPNWQQSGFDLTNIQAAPVGQDNYVPQVAVPGQQPPAGTQPPATTPPGTQPPATTTPATTTTPTTYTDPTTGKVTTLTGGDGDNQRNIALISKPDFALNQMMRAIGLDPSGNNAFTTSIMNALKPQLGRFMQLQGLGDGQANYIDNAQNSLQDFTNRVNGGAGLFEGLNQFAQQQKQAAFTPGSKFMSSDNETQMAALSQLTALGTSGMNPLMQAAWKRYFDQAQDQSDLYDYNQLGTGNNNRSAADWLRNSQWADLLR